MAQYISKIKPLGSNLEYDIKAVYASSATYATTAGYAVTAAYAGTANHAKSALSASYAVTAAQAITATYANTANRAKSALTADYAVTAAYAIAAAVPTTTYAAARYANANGKFTNSTVIIDDAGRITTPVGITIKSNDAYPHLEFTRNGYNYINLTGGTSAILAIGTNSNAASTWYIINSAKIGPQTNNTKELGSQDLTWKNIYVGVNSSAVNGGIKFSNSSSTLASIGANTSGGLGIYGTHLYLRPNGLSDTTVGVEETSTALYPTKDNDMTLGQASNRWKGIYFGSKDTYGSNTNPVYWTNGLPTSITYTANRLYYSESTTSFAATLHYSNATAVAINSTEEPAETFLVNGNSQLKGTVWINSTADVIRSTTGSGALVIGEKDKQNLSLDSDEIMARNGTTTGSLALQFEGGSLYIGNTASYVNPFQVYASPAYYIGYHEFNTAGGFKYSGIQRTDTANYYRPIWFDKATSSTDYGTPAWAPELYYTPNTGTIAVAQVPGTTTIPGLTSRGTNLIVHASGTSAASDLYLQSGIASTPANGLPGGTIFFRQGSSVKGQFNKFGALVLASAVNDYIGNTSLDATTGNYTFANLSGRSYFSNQTVHNNDIIFHPKGKGIWFKDSSGATYAGIIDNGTNLWIGAQQGVAIHHKGQLLLSTGHNGTTANDYAMLEYPVLDNPGIGHATNTYGYYITHTPAMTANRLIYSVSNHGKSQYAPQLETNGNYLHINSAPAISDGTQATAAALVIGPQTGVHMAFSGNKILAFGNTTASNQWLTIQEDGGGINTGGTAGIRATAGPIVTWTGRLQVGRRSGWNQGASPGTMTSNGLVFYADGTFHSSCTGTMGGGYWGMHFNGSSATTAYIGEAVSGTVRVGNRLVVNTSTHLQTLNGAASPTAFQFAVIGNGFIRDTVYTNAAYTVRANRTAATGSGTFINFYNRGQWYGDIIYTNGTTTTAGYTQLRLGNNLARGVDKKSYGYLSIYTRDAGAAAQWAERKALNGTTRDCMRFSYAQGTQIWGAVWNDYAEFRQTKEKIEPGRCVIETGKGDLILSVKRLQAGAEIVSDTFGFAIGQSEKSNTPIATTGRVLAYLHENREIARQNIGGPVCSGPNGTVSIMTDEEARYEPWKIIGTISEIPDYEKWQVGEIDGDPLNPCHEDPQYVDVKGRIWIRIR